MDGTNSSGRLRIATTMLSLLTRYAEKITVMSVSINPMQKATMME